VTEQNVPKAEGANPVSTGADQQLLVEVPDAAGLSEQPSLAKADSDFLAASCRRSDPISPLGNWALHTFRLRLNSSETAGLSRSADRLFNPIFDS